MKELEYYISFYGPRKRRTAEEKIMKERERNEKQYPGSSRYPHKFFNNLITGHSVLWF